MGFVEFYNASDRHIWDKFREGNPNAFEIIYERNISVLANYGNRMCSDGELVKDAIQDMFVDIWRNRAGLGITDSIKFYLIKAFRRNLIRKMNAARKLDSSEELPRHQNGNFELSHELSIISAEIEQETLEQLNNLLEQLPARQKEAIFLRFYGGLNFAEIASTMEINQQSAHNFVFRALEALREKMTYQMTIAILILLLKA